jgi:hypothetical protein
MRKVLGIACGFAGTLIAISAMWMSAAQAQAQATATQSSTALPRVNVVGEKPKEKKTAPYSEAAAWKNAMRAPIKQPVTQTGCRTAMAPGKPYFVEFRSRTAASYGHTFVFYGRLGGGNKFASFKVAGLHPAGEDPSTYMQGHWAPVPAETGVSYGDLDEQYLTARFCVALTEVQYNKMVAYIRELQATKKTWHAMTYNCNSFGADIAKFIGLDTPNPNMYLPETFIKRLAEDNSKKKDGGGFASMWQPGLGGQQQKPATR